VAKLGCDAHGSRVSGAVHTRGTRLPRALQCRDIPCNLLHVQRQRRVIHPTSARVLIDQHQRFGVGQLIGTVARTIAQFHEVAVHGEVIEGVPRRREQVPRRREYDSCARAVVAGIAHQTTATAVDASPPSRPCAARRTRSAACRRAAERDAGGCDPHRLETAPRELMPHDPGRGVDDVRAEGGIESVAGRTVVRIAERRALGTTGPRVRSRAINCAATCPWRPRSWSIIGRSPVPRPGARHRPRAVVC
jgi:hypothetical protein